jgi:predicted ribosomally synthesized peptide with SipW-like signal peptide
MRKILGLTVAAVLVMGLVGGGTWAYFSDTEQTTGNIFAAGTLDLGLSNTDSGGTSNASTSATFSASDLYPGSTAGSGTLYINNNGSIAMSSINVTFSYSYTEGSPDTVTGYDATTGTDNMSAMMKITTATYNGTSVAALVDKSIDQLVSAGSINVGSLPVGDELPLALTWTFDATATNGCQGDSIDVTIDVTGNQ